MSRSLLQFRHSIPGWLVLRDGRVFWIAFVGSLLIHAVLYGVTPAFTLAFRPVKIATYQAALVPIEQIAAVSVPKAPSGSRLRTDPTANPRALPLPPPNRSEAAFVAPENSIAVAATSATSDVNSAPLGNNTLPTAPAAGERPALRLPEAVGESDTLVAAGTPALPPAASQTTPRRAPAFAERIAIEYKLSTAITDGVASFRWTRRGAEYEIESSIQATGFLVSAFAGVIHQQSKGVITEAGLRPQQFSIRRGEGEAELAEFKRETNALSLKRSGNSRTLPMTESMQDMQSFLFQLAYDAPQLGENGEKLDIVVTNARKVYRYQFRKLGTETLDTRFGAIETIRLLSEAANPEDQYEVWLAPGYFYLPIRLKYYLGRFPVEQLATRIGISADAAAR